MRARRTAGDRPEGAGIDECRPRRVVGSWGAGAGSQLRRSRASRRRRVCVELDIRSGLPAFNIVGLPGTAVREARERVRAAVLNSEFAFPRQRVTANLAPANLEKTGPGFDLALACAVLGASGQVQTSRLERIAFFAELSLGGELRPCRGSAGGGAGGGARGLPGPRGGAGERGRGRRGRAVCRLPDWRTSARSPSCWTVGGPRGRGAGAALRRRGHRAVARTSPTSADRRGRSGRCGSPRPAATTSCLSGPPGVGKTMLARRLPSILPPLRQVGGARGDEDPQRRRRARRRAAWSGSGRSARRTTRSRRSGWSAAVRRQCPERRFSLTTACSFSTSSRSSRSRRSRLYASRWKAGQVVIVRRARTAVYPTRFMLVAAMNPCPCGHLGSVEATCRCSAIELARHRRKLSGPLMDRIELLVQVGGRRRTSSTGPRARARR